MRADALKNKIRELFSVSGTGEPMSVTVQSFGFKHGLPLDSDMVLDVRFLPNPFYEDDLRMLTGNDEPVAQFIEHYPQTQQFWQRRRFAGNAFAAVRGGRKKPACNQRWLHWRPAPFCLYCQ